MDPSSEKAYAERPSAAAQQERIPDFVPGWFNRRGTTEVREAVCVRDLADFPIAFLRSDEFVSPAKPGRKGVTIGRRGWDMELAVPPGYWIARDDGGELFNWHPEEFGITWSRMDRPWTPARDREPTEGGWRGTPPAVGTRRRLILDVVEENLRGSRNAEWCLSIADAIEAALLDSTIHVEALDPAANTVAPGDTVEADDPDAPDAEILDSDGHMLGGLHVVVGAQDGVPYVSLCELECLFANLYEDITERQAKKQRAELTATRTMEARDGESKLRDNPYLSDEERSRYEAALEKKQAKEAALEAQEAPVDEFDVQREATRALYDRITDGPTPNPAELARVIAILGGPAGVTR